MFRAALTTSIMALAALWAGCVFAASEQGADVADDDGGARGDGDCFEDTDCVLAGPSCCDCPTYAVDDRSGWADACEQVSCPMQDDCPALEARCDLGTCVAVCAPMTCDLSCSAGFVVDAAGCTVCACSKGGAAAVCQVDTDCVRTPADCCGCDRGGSDTAVPAGMLDGFVDDLGCTGNESCPGVSTCTPGEEARCVGGQCVLAGDPSVPPPGEECGRPELPPCPSGQACVINTKDAEAGTGRCAAP